VLANVFRRKISANLDLGCCQSMLLTQTGLEMIRDFSVSLLQPAHHRRFMHTARLGFSAALGSSLEPTSNWRFWLFDDSRDLSQLQTVDVIVKQQQLLMIIKRRERFIERGNCHRSITLARYGGHHRLFGPVRAPGETRSLPSLAAALRPVVQRNLRLPPTIQIYDGVRDYSAQPTSQSAAAGVTLELRLAHAVNDFGAEEFGINRINHFVGV